MPRNVIRVLIVILLASKGLPAINCTTFLLKEGNHLLFGRNYDWMTSNGMICTNQRGLAKTAYPQGEGKPAQWISTYGSITFNQYGKEFPTGGMNEAGLVVELMWLDGTTFSDPADPRPVLSSLQWIQYQLDNCATIEQAIATTSKIRIASNSTPLHFLMADSSGNAAVVEFLDGQQIVFTGQQLPVPVLTNSRYDLLKPLSQKSNSLPPPFPFMDNSQQRFNTALKYLDQAAEKLKGGYSPVDYAFSILHSVAQKGFTQWSIVYDIRNKTIYFHNSENRQQRWFSMAGFSFSDKHPGMALPIRTPHSGEVTHSFEPFTTSLNKKMLVVTAEESAPRIVLTPREIKNRCRYAERISEQSSIIKSGL